MHAVCVWYHNMHAASVRCCNDTIFLLPIAIVCVLLMQSQHARTDQAMLAASFKASSKPLQFIAVSALHKFACMRVLLISNSCLLTILQPTDFKPVAIYGNSCPPDITGCNMHSISTWWVLVCHIHGGVRCFRAAGVHHAVIYAV